MAPRYRIEGMNVEHVREEDTVYCNLNAEDILDELQRTYHDLRMKLTRDGRHAEVNKRNPFARLVIQYTQDGHVFVTALLILRGYCYSYSFFANGRWRNVNDSKYNFVDSSRNLIAKESYGSNYTKDDVKNVGLSNLVRAVMSLHGNEPHNWRDWDIHLVFMFIESARLTPIASSFEKAYARHVSSVIDECDHTDRDLGELPRVEAIQGLCEVCHERLLELLQAPVYPIDALSYHYRTAWGSLSNSLNDQGREWSLNADTAKLLELPSDKAQQKIKVMDIVRIVKPF